MMQVLRPRDETELSKIIRDAHEADVPLEVIGAGSKRMLGRPVVADHIISTSSMYGVTLYEPGELVIGAKAGTSLRMIEDTLARRGQMLAFEPMDLASVLGDKTGGEKASEATIGGVLATHFSGARRVVSGSAKNHLLGVQAVNGYGQVLKSGGRVMKNVTGYNVRGVLAGSWGTLGVMTEVTLRVAPLPQETCSLVFAGLPDILAVELMCQALQLPYDVSGAIHIEKNLVRHLENPALNQADMPLTFLRLESYTSSLPYRQEKLKDILGSFGEIAVLDHPSSLQFWSEMRQLKVFQHSRNPFWRIVSAPTRSVDIVLAIKAQHPDCSVIYDWGGGQIWVLTPHTADAGASEVHRAVLNRGGNATLIRGDAALRESSDVFQPLEGDIQDFTKKLKHAFDPKGILNRGRMYHYC